MADAHGPERVTLYPHAGERQWSTEMRDEWKRDLAVEYVRADLAAAPGPERDTPEEERQCIGGDCRPEWNWRRDDCPVYRARSVSPEAVEKAAQLRALAEDAVYATLPLLPLNGSGGYYRVSERIDPTLVATVEEWATAAHAIAELSAFLQARAPEQETGEDERGCDSCGATGTLRFSPAHCATFCEPCWSRESG